MAQKSPNLNVKNLIVEQNKSIKDALNNITTNGLGACFLTNKGKLTNVVTDGDIRRVIEKRKNIEDIIASEFMSINPKVLKSDILANEALKIMRKNNISQVLVADKNNSLIGVVHILDIIKQGINDE